MSATPQLKAKFKFSRKNLTFIDECNLIQKGGFFVMERSNEHLILGKSKDWKPASAKAYPESVEKDETGLTEQRKNELNMRCQRIVDMFLDPDAHTKQIQKQLHNFSQSLNSVEQEYVSNWTHTYVL